jgi:hypothetical protein
MPSSKAGNGGALAALVAGAALVLAGAAWGFAFYAPRVGHLSKAAVGAAESTERRDRVHVEVSEAMAPGGSGRPTLASVSRFFALEDDTLPCTVAENFGDEAARRSDQYAARPLKVGREVVLCLD